MQNVTLKWRPQRRPVPTYEHTQHTFVVVALVVVAVVVAVLLLVSILLMQETFYILKALVPF